MRDTQRQRLYNAETQVGTQLDYAAAGARMVHVAGSTLTLPLELRFGSWEAAVGYVDAVRASAAFARRWPGAARAPVRVRRRAGNRAAHYEPPGTIALHAPPTGTAWSLRELVVLHEVAHHAVHHDGAGDPGHGPEYATVLLALIGDVMGPEVALLLTTAFADHGVAFSAPLTTRTA